MTSLRLEEYEFVKKLVRFEKYGFWN